MDVTFGSQCHTNATSCPTVQVVKHVTSLYIRVHCEAVLVCQMETSVATVLTLVLIYSYNYLHTGNVKLCGVLRGQIKV